MRTVHLPTATISARVGHTVPCAVVSYNDDGSADVIPFGSTKSRRGFAIWHLTDAKAQVVRRQPQPVACTVDDSATFDRAAHLSEAFLALQANAGNRTLAAAALGVSRQTVTDRVRLSGWIDAIFPARDGRPAKA